MKFENRKTHTAGASWALAVKFLFATVLALAFAGSAFGQLQITTSTFPGGVVGTAYPIQILQASGGTPPYGNAGSSCIVPAGTRWCVTQGTLPTGLNLSTDGILSGTPAGPAGPSNFVVQLNDSGAGVTTRAFTILVTDPLQIAPATLPSATIGSPYPQTTLTTTGGTQPVSWTIISGSLPGGMGLIPNTGTFTGTPANVAGRFAFTVQATDSSNPAQVTTANLSIAVPPLITTTTLPNGAVGTAYGPLTLQASPGVVPYTWAVSSGALPGGLLLSSSTGVIDGTPNAAAAFNFTLSVTDSSTPPLVSTKPLTITIQPQLTISSTSPLPTGVVGSFYNYQFTSSPANFTSSNGSPTSVTWSRVSGTLPPNLQLTSSGSLSGTPVVAQTFVFDVEASGGNPVQTVQKQVSVTVNPALTITTPTTLPDAFLGVDYSLALSAAGGVGTYTWGSPGGGQPTGLPPGLSLSSTGVITGRPAGTGLYRFTVKVDDSFTPIPQTDTRTFDLRVNNALTITTTSVPIAIQNIPYSQQFQAAGGTPPLSWGVSSGTLPTGLLLSPAGVLAGTPTTAESKAVTITVTDARGLSSSKDFTITVNAALPVLSAPNLPAIISPASAVPVAFVLASPFPSTLTGKLVLTFTYKSEVPGDDPLTRFSNGTRSVSFTIPANTTSAVLDPVVSLTAGSVAGTVRLAANFESGPQDVTVGTTEIASTAPHINSVTAVRTARGLEVQITGYSPARRIITAEFTFDLSIGGKTDHQTVVGNVGPTFAAWFTNSASIQFGSAFSYVQSFDYTGNVSDVQSVTVRLTNAQGSVSSSVITFK